MDKDLEFEVTLEEDQLGNSTLLGGIMDLHMYSDFIPKGSAIISDFMAATNNYKQIMMDEQDFKTHKLMQTPKISKDLNSTPNFEKTPRSFSQSGVFKYNFSF